MEKKIVFGEVASLDIDDEMTLFELLRETKSFISQFGGDAQICFYFDQDDNPKLAIEKDRLETDEEYNLRLEHEERQRTWDLKQEEKRKRKQFEKDEENRIKNEERKLRTENYKKIYGDKKNGIPPDPNFIAVVDYMMPNVKE